MSKLDEILYKRLERIREELDSYIAEKIEEPLMSAPIMQAPTVNHSIAGSFLNKLRLEDEEDELEYDYDDEYNTLFTNQINHIKSCIPTSTNRIHYQNTLTEVNYNHL